MAKGRAVYRMRKAIVEPVFGQIKAARGFRPFLLRGFEKVSEEWALVCAAHNLLKWHRNGGREAIRIWERAGKTAKNGENRFAPDFSGYHAG